MVEQEENIQNEVKDNDKLPMNINKKAIPLKHKYKLKQKLNIVKEATLTSIHAVSNKYGIDRTSVRDCIKQKDILEK
jgi:hypothetical protein